MKPSFWIIPLGLLLVALSFSYGHGKKPSAVTPMNASYALSGLDDRITDEVLKHLGVRYKRGGSSSSGVDCSGFVRLIYRRIFQVDLPYVAASQSRLSIFDDIPFEDLKTGDLIYFTRTPQKKKINHVGIYLADGEFAHAIEAKGVTVSSLSKPHWKVRVKKIKRIKNSSCAKPIAKK